MAKANLAGAGRVTVSTTAAPITTSNISGELLLSAPSTNTGSIFIGLADVDISTKGFELEPGDKVPVNAVDLSKVYAVVSAGTESLSFMASVL